MTATTETQYTVRLNGAEYELNEDARKHVQEAAERQYSENSQFSCWWKVASPDQYEEGMWEETIHDAGDAVLVIETTGPMVPWERLDQLDVEMQEVGPESELDRQMDEADTDPNEKDASNGMKTIDPSDVDMDETEKEIGRTHFQMTPQSFEDVPDPDGEEADRVPPKPVQMSDEPELIKWIPNNPEIDHTWSSGEAITSMHNRVEWNVQKKADQPMLAEEKETSHDHWQSILSIFGCEKLRELDLSQDPADSIPDNGDEDVPDEFVDGKYGGGHWTV